MPWSWLFAAVTLANDAKTADFRSTSASEDVVTFVKAAHGGAYSDRGREMPIAVIGTSLERAHAGRSLRALPICRRRRLVSTKMKA